MPDNIPVIDWESAAEVGFRQAVAERDDPYGDRGRSTFKG